EVEEEEEREEEEAAGQMEEEEEEGEQQEEEKEVRRGHPRGRALFLPAVSCLGRAGGRRPGVPQGPRPAAEPPGAGWPGRTRAGPAASRREKKKTHGGRSAAMCLALRTGWGPRWRTLRRLAYACAAPCSSLAARATLPGPRAAPGGPGTGGAGPAARARCGASAGVRSSLGGCTEKHPLCPDGRRPGRDIGSGAASRRPTAWWGPRRRQRWPYSVLTSRSRMLLSDPRRGKVHTSERYQGRARLRTGRSDRRSSGPGMGREPRRRRERHESSPGCTERGDPAKQRQASPVGSRLGSQPAGKGSGPSWSGDRLESLCGPQH
ncbi:unnamed protein product, partial [Prorocentrum cordatum]